MFFEKEEVPGLGPKELQRTRLILCGHRLESGKVLISLLFTAVVNMGQKTDNAETLARFAKAIQLALLTQLLEFRLQVLLVFLLSKLSNRVPISSAFIFLTYLPLEKYYRRVPLYSESACYLFFHCAVYFPHRYRLTL